MTKIKGPHSIVVLDGGQVCIVVPTRNLALEGTTDKSGIHYVQERKYLDCIDQLLTSGPERFTLAHDHEEEIE